MVYLKYANIINVVPISETDNLLFQLNCHTDISI